MLSDIYYTVRPLIPRWAQIMMRRKHVQRLRRMNQDIWPIWEPAGNAPPMFPGWPGGKKFAVVLTHDVEWDLGVSRCEELAARTAELGFRAGFAFVARRYQTPDKLRLHLQKEGFEVMLHGLYHDGKLYRTRQLFEERLEPTNEYLRNWKTRGFVAPSTLHNLPWNVELDIDHDISTYDTDPFEPQQCGVGRAFPYWVQAPDGKGRGFVEMPYTLAQDFTLYILLEEKTNAVWCNKLDWIAERGAMALVKTHPDYMHFDGERQMDQYPLSFYLDLLKHIRDRYGDDVWVALPSEMAAFWRSLKVPPAVEGSQIVTNRRFCPLCRVAHDQGWLTDYCTA